MVGGATVTIVRFKYQCPCRGAGQRVGKHRLQLAGMVPRRVTKTQPFSIRRRRS